MRALVTGATGFLGGRLAQRLLAHGAAVTLLARRPEALPPALAAHTQVVRGSLTDLPALALAARDVTHIFHCAAAATDWATPAVFYESNVAGTERLLQAARACTSLHRFVHVSTTDVYGYPRHAGDETLPMVDRKLGYNRTKIAAEHAVWAASAGGLPVTILRPATIYGAAAGDAPVPLVTGIVDELRRGSMLLVDRGRAPAGLVYVDDVADAMLGVCAVEATQARAYNLAAGSRVTWAEYVGALARGLGLKTPWLHLPFSAAMALAAACELPFRFPRLPGRPLLTRHAVYLLGRDQEFTSQRARADFGWSPRVPFEQGIAQTIAWVQGLPR